MGKLEDETRIQAGFTGEDKMFGAIKCCYLMNFTSLVMIFTLSIHCCESNSKESLSAELKVQSVTLTKQDESTMAINVGIEVILTNNGRVPIILLNTDGFPHFKSGFILAENREKLTSKEALVFNFNGESIDTSPKWNLLAKNLDTLRPTEKYFIRLDTGQNIILEQEIKFQLPISSKSGSSYSAESWEKISAIPEVWIQIIGDTWSLNLDKASGNLSCKLRKRWRKYGYLWTRPIISKPAKLKFQVAIEK